MIRINLKEKAVRKVLVSLGWGFEQQIDGKLLPELKILPALRSIEFGPLSLPPELRLKQVNPKEERKFLFHFFTAFAFPKIEAYWLPISNSVKNY
jgi:hypothetical protein